MIIKNITYLKVNNVELKLDVYKRGNTEEPVPTLIYFHGGGWVSGTKESRFFNLLPYLEMGLAVVNVQYRLANVSHAPAAVEDCLCALRWVIRQADKYGFDIKKLVVSGDSAGGHLALTTGMLTPSSFDSQCPGNEELKVAAIVNWYGITDVGDLLEGENMRSYALEWLGSAKDRMEIAERVSPLNYLRSDLPPIITIHGDADTVVPYSHAVQLHQGLERLKVPNKLITIPNGGHGNFTRDEILDIYENIHKFLDTHIVNKKLEN
ncbi:alpha/beta hydrolase fold domain-containing protein [Dapis sp. BLCC M126]|uniref:alpha/beta hydrolase fold domain-containing protein n=1 Tax=Dapis sp. BLCC M126 TaxID=3400189 RepID=UPI003CF3C67C